MQRLLFIGVCLNWIASEENSIAQAILGVGISTITNNTKKLYKRKLKHTNQSWFLNRVYIKANAIKQEQDPYEHDHERDQTTETPSKTEEPIISGAKD